MENTRKEFDQLRNAGEFDSLPNRCQNCDSTENLHIHHIVPLVYGGTNRVSNMARLCGECHSKVHGNDSLKIKKSDFVKDQGRIPFGYGKTQGKILPNADALIVRTIFELRFVHKFSSGAITEALNELNIPTAYGNKWSNSTIFSRMFKIKEYFNESERYPEPIMQGSEITWEIVKAHNELGKGGKRTQFPNGDRDQAKAILQELLK